MTLTQLGTFVLVAKLGSVKAAATALGVSEPAVSQALSALRQHLGDPLIERAGPGMRLTAAGSRLLPVASQMVSLGADAAAAVRAGQGAPEQLRLVASSAVVEFVASPLVDTFVEQSGRKIDTSSGVAASDEMPVLVGNRFADVAIGPNLAADRTSELCSEAIFRTYLILVASGSTRPHGPPDQWPWLVDPSATDPASDCGRLLRRLHVPESRTRVFPNQTAAWAAAADGAGVAPAHAHLVAERIRRGELRVVDTPATPLDATWYATALPPERRSTATDAFLHFLHTAAALRVMRKPGAGVPPSKFRPPVYVTLWS
ncbi:MAG TPA: LysR family transcriptional regulator [Actinophytocola sp.]|uniref:LysR family transcriptional regulator n=1 Tax=Actinophytocola sp. TaxID=1872138 RepID=UPI002DDDA0E9|nr:LysR family transcriptional regulator [Actinophytocola sp.]HEV2778778.1 LysR family transcriptional regulator [Actinophytocola sp.]